MLLFFNNFKNHKEIPTLTENKWENFNTTDKAWNNKSCERDATEMKVQTQLINLALIEHRPRIAKDAEVQSKTGWARCKPVE